MDSRPAGLDWRVRRQLGTLGLLAGLAAALVVVSQLSDRFDARRRAEPPERVLYLPKGDTLKYMCLGYNGVAADLVWIRGVLYVGKKLQNRDRKYEWMEKLFRVTTDLDPHWSRPYRAGGILLAAVPQDDERAFSLLRLGMERNPYDWEIVYQAAQLSLVRGRNGEAVGYMKRMVHGWEEPGAILAARPASTLDAQDRILMRSMESYPRFIHSTMASVEQERGRYSEAVKAAADGLASLDERFMRAVTARNYREALARMMASELTGAAAAYRAKKGVLPANLAALAALPSVQEQFRARLAPSIGVETAAATVAMLPADPLGMEFYIRSDGTVASRGLERIELSRMIDGFNTYMKNAAVKLGRPVRSVDELTAYFESLYESRTMPAGLVRILGKPPRMPPCPTSNPLGWRSITIENGLFVMPKGPATADLLATPWPLPAGPAERAAKTAATR